MTAATRTRLDVVLLTRHIGAEIRGIDLREKPDGETIQAIHQAWLDHLVIIFPGQKLSQEDLVRVTRYFGEQAPHSRPAKYFPKGYSSLLPGIMLISNIRENGEPIGALRQAASSCARALSRVGIASTVSAAVRPRSAGVGYCA